MAKKWIQKAIKKRGALTKTAKRAGAVGRKGTINKTWLKAKASKGGTTGKRARLAVTLSKMRKKKGK
jgi:hypothetical protein